MDKLRKMILITIIIIFTLTGCVSENVSSNQANNKEDDHAATSTTSSPLASAPSPTKDSEVTNSVTEIPTEAGILKVYYLNVGQGDCTYIETGSGDNILIDGGDNLQGDSMVDDLKDLKVTVIDVMIATHPDADHIGGLDTVLEAFDVKSVYTPKVINNTKTYEDFVSAVKDEGLKIKPAKAKLELPLKSLNAVFLAPVKEYGSELNEWSTVLKIEFGKTSFLFTGDAPISSEEDMIASGQDLTADVLKLGHHGSNTSSSEKFLKAVNPEYAVISVGKNNRYGHPDSEILSRLQVDKIKYFRTDKQGTIIAKSDGKKITWNNKAITKEGTNNSDKTTAEDKTNNELKILDKGISTGILKATLDNYTPNQNDTITLNVAGIKGASYEAICHYKSKNTVYTGTVGEPLAFKIGPSAIGFKVTIDITVSFKGYTYTTQTSFTPQ